MRHDGDEFFNKSTAEMKKLFDETFDISNEELVSIEEEFSLLIEGLKVDILLADLSPWCLSVPLCQTTLTTSSQLNRMPATM